MKAGGPSSSVQRAIASLKDQLEGAYGHRSFFDRLKARLLAGIALMVLVFVPVNIVKTLWVEPTFVAPRILVNLVIGIAAVMCLRLIVKGRPERAGDRLALVMVLAIYVTILIVGAAAAKPLQPLSVGIQSFAYDIVILLVAILFASRIVATSVFLITVLGQVFYYYFMLRQVGLGPTSQYAANTLFRDGLLSKCLVFALGVTLMRMIETAHLRTEESLRRTHKLNQELEVHELAARKLSERQREFLEIQREFISMVSHEFRTPITTVQGTQFLIERLLKGSGIGPEDMAKAEKWLRLQESGLERLNSLVDQVLLLNRIEHVTGKAVMETLLPAEVIEETVRRFNDSMDSPRVDLQIDLPDRYEAPMDSALVKAAAENLISNGLKYSEPERRVDVRVYPNPDGWSVDVIDRGRGIPKGDQGSLFRPFFRAGNVGTVPGAGLGLAIVQRAVAFHNGSVDFESSESLGTRFTLRFPIARVPEPDAEASAAPAIGGV